MRVSVVFQERNAVFQLQSEGLDQIIDNDDIFKPSIFDNP